MRTSVHHCMPVYLISNMLESRLRKVERQKVLDKTAIALSYDVASVNHIILRRHVLGKDA